MWEYKRTNKKFQGLTVYQGYLFGEFQGYFYKNTDKLEKKLSNKIKIMGYNNYKPFFRNKSQSWEQFAENFV